MTDEEKKAIENLKEVVDLYNDECLITTDYDFKSIETLLNLIETQQKEIEELKEKTKKCEYYEMVADELSKEIEELKKPKYIMNFETNEITTLTNDFISKAKIKAKIEELEKEQDDNRKRLYNAVNNLCFKEIDKISNKICVNMTVRDILQSLLEKE